jgi:hypothetical protein
VDSLPGLGRRAERRKIEVSFHVPAAHLDEVVKIVGGNIARESRLHPDESKLYHRIGKEFVAHETVNHAAKEYARGDVTTNTVEG